MLANAEEVLIGMAVSGSLSKTFAGSGSVVLNQDKNTIDAYASHATLTGSQGLTVSATDSSTLFVVAGAIAGSTGTVAIGASVSDNVVSETVKAYLDDSKVTNTSSVTVFAGFDQPNSLPNNSKVDLGVMQVSLPVGMSSQILSVAFGGTGAGSASVAGAVTLNQFNNTIEASIDDGSNVATTGTGNISVTAQDTSQINTGAGGIAGAGTASVGASAATNTIDNIIRAYIDSSTVTPGGTLTVTATEAAGITAVTIGGSGAGTVAVGGAVTVNNIGNTVDAHVSGTANITAGGAVTISATDIAVIAAAAGGIAGAGTVAVGAGVATNTIGDTVTADVTGGTIQAGGDITLSATFTRPANLPAGLNAQISSLAVAGAVSGTVSIAGAVTTNEIDNLVAADASGGADIGAGGAINLSSSDNSSIDSLAGQGSISGSVAVGAATAYNDLGSTIRASSSDATLNAGTSLSVQAQSTASIETIAVGGSVSYYAGVAGSVAVNRTHDTIEASLKNGTYATAQDNATLLASADNTTTTTGGALAGGAAGVGGTVVVNSIRNATQAFVDSSTVFAYGKGGTVGVDSWDNVGNESTDNMRGLAVVATAQESITNLTVCDTIGVGGLSLNVCVNTISDTTRGYINNTQAVSYQSVKVRAHQATTINDAGGVVSGGGVGAGAVVDTSILDSTTQALIEGGSTVFAGDGLTVATVTNENVMSMTAGASGGEGAAIAGAASVDKSTSTNEAGVIDSNPTVTGYLDVTAANQSEATLHAGTITGSVLGGAAGGAIVVALLGDSTTAHIVGSTTSATGTTLVDADSGDTICTLAGTAGGGGMAGIAGAVSVSEDTSSTTAAIDSDSNGVSNVSSQTVNVLATNSVSVTDKDGSVGLGSGAGAGVSVDVISVMPSVDAFLGNRVTVNATGNSTTGNVEVEATGTKNVRSTVVSFAGGLAAGVQGSVAVIGVGIGLDGQGESQATPMQSTVDGQIGLSGGAQELDTSNPIASAAQNDTTTSLSIDGALSTTQTPAGTAAFIGTGATVTAGGSVTVQAQETESITAIVGGASGGFASVGGSVVVVNLGNLTQAYLGSSSVVSAGGSVTVQAIFADTGNATAEAGQVGLVGLGAQLARVTDNSSEAAWTGTGAQITQALGSDLQRQCHAQSEHGRQGH